MDRLRAIVQERRLAREKQKAAAVLFITEARSRRTARECARGAAAAALVAIASAVANVAVGLAAALVLIAGLLGRRVIWLWQARSQRHAALTAEMAASFAASDWTTRTRWGLKRTA